MIWKSLICWLNVTFRIKIWDKNNNDAIVYDNKLGEDDAGYETQELGGGSITIHKSNSQKSIGMPASIVSISEVESLLVQPNPFRDKLSIQFTSNTKGVALAELYSVTGVRIVPVQKVNVNYLGTYQIDFHTKNLVDGVYIMRLVTPSGQVVTVKVFQSK